VVRAVCIPAREHGRRASVWLINSIQKTVLRVGAGLYYDRIQGNPTMYTLNNPPYVGSVQYQYGNLANIAGGAAVSAPWGTIQVMDPKLKIPYSEQVSFGIQRELPLHLFGEVDYVGSFGRHLLTEPDINQPSWVVLSAASSTANENSLRPYAGYSTIQQFMSAGTSNYHGLQTRLERRVKGVFFTTAYTFAKNLSDASSDTENDFNAFNIRAMYGPAFSSNADLPSMCATRLWGPWCGTCRHCAAIAACCVGHSEAGN